MLFIAPVDRIEADICYLLGPCKEIKPVYPKGDQSRVFIGRTDVEGETPIFWPPDVKD